MLFVSVERERERERERFLEREPLEFELVMGPTIFVLFFFKYIPSPEFLLFRFFFFFLIGEK